MTGFGSGSGAAGDLDLSVEIRSVNAKFCEVKVRMPRDLLALEAAVQRQVKERLARGGIEVSVRRTRGTTLAPRIDEALAERYLQTFRSLRDRLGLQEEIRFADVLRAEGVLALEEEVPDLGAAEEALGTAMAAALDRLVEMREREGAALRADLLQRLARVRELVGQVEPEVPAALTAHRDRIAQRVEELTGGVPVDPQRLAQEIALLAERADVAEELTRLQSHFEQFDALLAAEEAVGRRMDFLVQEMNREVNTIASKSQWSPIAALAVELKAEIERIREQVQNVE